MTVPVDMNPHTLQWLEANGYELWKEFTGPSGSGKGYKSFLECQRLEAEGYTTHHFVIWDEMTHTSRDVVYRRKREG